MARIFSRRKPAVTAAVQPIRDPAKTFRATLSGRGSKPDWQSLGWEMYEQCGELRYVCKWLSGGLSRCRLVASEIDPETGRPTGSTENVRANEIVRDIAGGPGGQAQLLGRAAVFLTVPGEGFVAVIIRGREGDAETEEWHLLDRSEVAVKGTDIELTLADGTKHQYIPDRDVLFRVWNPHPRNSQEADSPVRSVLPALAEIVQTTATIRHASKSRLIGGKILFVPSEMSLPKVAQAPTAAPVDPDAPSLPPSPVQEQATSQDLQDLLFDVAKAAADDPDSAAAHLPIIASVAGEWTDKTKLVDLHSDINAEQLTIREAAIRRVALGMDVPAEVLLGVAEMNHWNAWAMRDDAVTTHIVPLLETITDALTTALLRPVLVREGLDPDAFVVWYDTTELTQDPDRHDEALAANERGALRNDALLKHLGFTEDDGYDLTTLAGIQQFARDQAARRPELLPTLAPLLGVTMPDLPTAETGPAGAPRAIESRQEEPAEPAVTAAAEPARAVATLLLMRALELAGKRRLTRADRMSLAGTPPHEVHTRMSPVPATDVARLISGFDAGLTNDIADAVGADPDRLRRLVADHAATALTRGRRVVIGPEIQEVLR